MHLGPIAGLEAVDEEGGRGQVAVHRHDVGGRDRANARKRGDPGLDLLVELLDRGGGVVAGARQRQADREHPGRLEPWVDGLHGLEAPRQQRRRHQEQRREHDLGEDHHGTQPSAAAGHGAIATLERVAQVAARCLKRGHQAKQQARGQRDPEREQRDPEIEPDLGDARQVRGPDRDERLDQSSCDHDAQRSAEHAEDRGLDDELGHDARPGRTEGGAHRELAPAGGAAHQEQVGDVGAGDEQHQPDRSQQQAQHRGGAPADFLGQRAHVHAGVGAVRIRIRHAQLPGDGLEVVGNLPDGDSRFHPSDDSKKALGPVGPAGIGGRGERHHDLAVAHERHEVRAQDADDPERLAIQHERLADGVGAAAEPALPQAVRDHRDRLRFVGRLNRAPQLDTRAGDREVVRRYPDRLDALRLTATRQVHAPREARDQGIEGAALGLEVGEVGERERLAIRARPDEREGDESARIAQRQRPQQDRVDQREHRGVGADRERKHEDHAHAEGGVLAEPANSLDHLCE